MFICRWIGWNIKNSGNYTFSTIFGTACYSLSSMIVPNQIRNEMQCCQFLSHIPYTVLHNECICFGYSQRYFQNHIGREIIFSTTSLIFLLSSFMIVQSSYEFYSKSTRIPQLFLVLLWDTIRQPY